MGKNKKQNQKVPRDFCIYFGGSFPFNKLIIGDHQNTVHIENGKDKKGEAIVFSQTESKRKDKSNKVRNWVPSISDPIGASYLSGFDEIVSIDTNTRQIRGEEVSICVFTQCQVSVESSSISSVSERTVSVLWFKGLSPNKKSLFSRVHPEKFSWSRCFPFLEKESNKKRVMITDHDLGNLSDYNSRKKPIFDDIYLPESITFIYACSDKKPVGIHNYLVKECDKRSNDFFEELVETDRFLLRDREIIFEEIPFVYFQPSKPFPILRLPRLRISNPHEWCF